MGQKSIMILHAPMSKNQAQCSVFLANRTGDSSFSPIFTLRTPPFCPIIVLFVKLSTEAFNISTECQGLSNMTDVQGYCMKCKQYGPIKDGKKIVMSNGRTRMAGFCSQSGCTGKISKIIA
jgi:hypothetical protein